MRPKNGGIHIDPCLPKTWGSAEVEIKGPAGSLAIQIEDPEHVGCGTIEMTVDAASVTTDVVAFPTDGSVRNVRVRLGRLVAPPTASAEVLTERETARSSH